MLAIIFWFDDIRKTLLIRRFFMNVDTVAESVTSIIDPISALENSKWNGREVQTQPQTRAWLVLQIPIQTPNPLPDLGHRITTINSRALPTLENVLQRNGLEFGSRFLYEREIEQLLTADYAWVVIPLNTSGTAPSLQRRVDIDTNPSNHLDKILERKGIRAPINPYFPASNLV
jgi:hypothetical protein